MVKQCWLIPVLFWQFQWCGVDWWLAWIVSYLVLPWICNTSCIAPFSTVVTYHELHLIFAVWLWLLLTPYWEFASWSLKITVVYVCSNHNDLFHLTFNTPTEFLVQGELHFWVRCLSHLLAIHVLLWLVYILFCFLFCMSPCVKPLYWVAATSLLPPGFAMFLQFL